MKQVDLDLHFHPYDKNSEIYREFLEFDPEIKEFCPKMQILSSEQGTNREFPLPIRMNKGDLSLHCS
jgi:hypothetical protein